MGMHVNPGNGNFAMSVNTQPFVDKSMLLAEILKLVNTDRRFVCVSRARRFGKTMAANMLSAYFSKACDSRSLFRGLKIASVPGYDRYLNQLNVLFLDVNAFLNEFGPCSDLVEKFTARIRRELCRAFPEAEIENGDSLSFSIQKIYSVTGEQFVIIMDEYDVLVRERVPQPLFDSYLRFLNAMFKNPILSPAIALAYLTGILPIVRDKIQSKLNLFEEYTMMDSRQLTPYTGFSTEEVQALCRDYGMDFAECRRWYDGYRINGLELYSPKSVVSAMEAHKCDGYWCKTGSFESLTDYIRMDFKGIREAVKSMLGGEKVDVQVKKYMNTMTGFHSLDEAFTYLIHIGYLAYDEDRRQCYIPNWEIAEEWALAIEDNDNYKEVSRLLSSSRRLVDSMISGDGEAVAKALNSAHQEICNNLNYNSEGTFQSVILTAFFFAKAKYTVFKELTTGKGYADVVLVPYLPDIPAVIIELKRNSCPESALAQIEKKQYFASLEKYSGNLLFAGVNYDEKTREHTCLIRRFVKE